MHIDWVVVATIAAPLIALFVGAFLNRWIENRPVLNSYFGHVSSFRANPPGGVPFVVNTHAIVLRNVGRLAAKNVRLRHLTLPDFNIWPGLNHYVEPMPTGEREIVIPTLVPNEEVTISYLYFPPLTFNQINAGIRCDQGFANAIPVLLKRQYPPAVTKALTLLLLLGTIAAVYLIYEITGIVFRLVR
jgi:hypothetical protein